MKKFWNELEDNICGILLLVMMLLTCVNVFARYVLLSSMPFVEELTNAGLILLSIAGAAVAAKRGSPFGPDGPDGEIFSGGTEGLRSVGRCPRHHLWPGHPVLRYSDVRSRIRAGTEDQRHAVPEGAFGAMIPVGGAFLAIRYCQLFIRTLKSDATNSEDKEA